MSCEYVLRLLHRFPKMQGILTIIEDLRSHVGQSERLSLNVDANP